MDIEGMMDDVMDDVEQYAKQRASGVSWENADAARKLRTALRKNDIDVDEVRYIGPDPSLMYYHDADEHTRDIVTIALVAAKARKYIPNVLAVTALESEHSRLAHFSVEREWLDEYEDADLSKKAFAKRVLDTQIDINDQEDV